MEHPEGLIQGKAKYWIAGLVGAAIVLYLLLRSPNSGSSGSGTTLYTTGFTPAQSLSLAQSGMNLQLGLAQTAANKQVSLAGINAAEDVSNKQTAAGITTANIMAAMEEALGKLGLQGLESTNNTQVQIAGINSATEENIVHTMAPSALDAFTSSYSSAVAKFFGAVSPVAQLGQGGVNNITQQPSSGGGGSSAGGIITAIASLFG